MTNSYLRSGKELDVEPKTDLKLSSMFSKHVNFILLFEGTPKPDDKPSSSIANNLIQHLTRQFDRDSLSLEIPTVFHHIREEDPKFEVVQSNTLQPTTLFFQKNVVTKSTALIFINSEAMGVKYKHVEERAQ